jgi:hypothetical protein
MFTVRQKAAVLSREHELPFSARIQYKAISMGVVIPSRREVQAILCAQRGIDEDIPMQKQAGNTEVSQGVRVQGVEVSSLKS